MVIRQTRYLCRNTNNSQLNSDCLIMKKNLTLLLAFVLMTLTQVFSQTDQEIFVIDLKVDGNVVATYREAACGFSTASWGGSITEDFCLPVVWAYGVNGDSLMCDSSLNNYAGKLVMIRRGGCEFGYKALEGEQAGAAAAAVVNNISATAGDDCNNPGMGAGAVGAQVTIPAVLFSRAMAAGFDDALKAGKQPEACFRRLTLHDPSAEYSYATPVSQADTVNLISVQAVNRTGVGQEMTAKVEITDPAGNVTVLESTQFIEAAADSIFYFPDYVPVPMVGTYTLKYTADLATNVGDTLTRKFLYTDYTYAADNLISNGGAANNTSFVTGGRIYRAASLYRTGDAGLTVQYATFGINNAAATAVADPAANVVNVVLYDADEDGDGFNNLGTGTTAFDALPFVAFNDFTYDATQPVDQMINVELTPIDGDKVELKPNHLYYVCLIYDGNAAANDIQLSFTATSQVTYTQFTGPGLNTPITLDALYSGWGGSTVIARMHEVPYDPTTSVNPDLLAKTKFSITPNPAVDYTSVNLQLAEVNESVIVSLVDFNGRTVAKQTVKNFQNGQIKFNTNDLPSGNYFVSIRTSQEGRAGANLMICH